MPRVAYHHTVDRRGPREQDIGYARALSRRLRFFIVEPECGGQPYRVESKHRPIFEAATVPAVVEYLRRRLGEAA